MRVFFPRRILHSIALVGAFRTIIGHRIIRLYPSSCHRIVGATLQAYRMVGPSGALHKHPGTL